MNNARADDDAARSEARAACQKLMHRYAESLDRGDIDSLREIFAHAVLRAEGQDDVSWRGGDAAVDMLTAFTVFYDRDEQAIDVRAQPGTPRTMHVLTNVDVDVDAGVATARSCYTVSQQLSDFPLQIIIQGRYRDRFERIDGVWRFAERVYIVSLTGDLSRHQKRPLPGDGAGA